MVPGVYEEDPIQHWRLQAARKGAACYALSVVPNLVLSSCKA